MTGLVDFVAGTAILTGAFVVGVAALGLIRLRDPFMRMHAATKAGVVGSGLIVFGSALALGGTTALVLGVACVVFLVVTSPIASHALGRAAYVSGAPIAPETVANALAGALPRNVFDIAPGRSSRTRSAARGVAQSTGTQTGVYAMSALETPRSSPAMQSTEPGLLRSMTVWLSGGERQNAAIDVAMAMADAAGAKIVGLSALDPSAGVWREMVPVGGLAWAKWRSDRARLAHRERAAEALAAFEGRAKDVAGGFATRHAEGPFEMILAQACGNDLIVVPASVDPAGFEAHDAHELAARLSAHGVGPILRVARVPISVRRVVMLVSADETSGRGVQALVQTGLWRGAQIGVVPVGAPSDQLALVAERHVELLGAHGYKAVETPAIGHDVDRDALEALIGKADACVAPSLSGRKGAFDVFRLDASEFAAARVPLLLLP